MNKKTIISIIVTVLILLALGSYWFINQNTNKYTPSSSSLPIPTKEATSSGVQTTFSYKCEKDKSALNRLQQSYPSVQTQDTTLGKLVTSIAGLEQGNGKYWLFSVDDKEATIGAQAYICQNQEEIKWELR